ncbi:hypothetical protein EBZ80_12895 [bacterium]|nr:hypothetical protein [bacterium]
MRGEIVTIAALADLDRDLGTLRQGWFGFQHALGVGQTKDAISHFHLRFMDGISLVRPDLNANGGCDFALA